MDDADFVGNVQRIGHLGNDPGGGCRVEWPVPRSIRKSGSPDKFLDEIADPIGGLARLVKRDDAGCLS